MERRFDAIVLVPIAVVVGLGLGVTLTTGQFPTDAVSRVASMMVGVWIALIVIEMIVRMVADGVFKALYYPEPELEPNEGEPGELTVLLVRDGDVVGEMKSWDKPLDKGKRSFWASKLGRILARQRLFTSAK